MKEIREFCRRIGDEADRFDIEFRQAQGDQAIFDAALQKILDYLSIRYGHADQPRLQGTVEYLGRQELGLTQSHKGTKTQREMPSQNLGKYFVTLWLCVRLNSAHAE
jgi:hypothetical protein